MVCPKYISSEHSESNPGGFATTLGIGGNCLVHVAILLESLQGGHGRSLFQRKRKRTLGFVAVGNDIVFPKFLFGQFSGSRKEHSTGAGALLVAPMARSRFCGMVFFCLCLEFVAAPTSRPASDGLLVHGIDFCIHDVVPSHRNGGIQDRIRIFQEIIGFEIHSDSLFHGHDRATHGAGFRPRTFKITGSI